MIALNAIETERDATVPFATLPKIRTFRTVRLDFVAFLAPSTTIQTPIATASSLGAMIETAGNRPCTVSQRRRRVGRSTFLLSDRESARKHVACYSYTSGRPFLAKLMIKRMATRSTNGKREGSDKAGSRRAIIRVRRPWRDHQIVSDLAQYVGTNLYTEVVSIEIPLRVAWR